MGKDHLATGVNALFGEPRPLTKTEAALSPETLASIEEARDKRIKKRGRPKKESLEDNGFFRTTIIAHRENYEKLKVVAMKLGRPFKDVLNDALSAAVETFEEKNGEITLREYHENPFK